MIFSSFGQCIIFVVVCLFPSYTETTGFEAVECTDCVKRTQDLINYMLDFEVSKDEIQAVLAIACYKNRDKGAPHTAMPETPSGWDHYTFWDEKDYKFCYHWGSHGTTLYALVEKGVKKSEGALEENIEKIAKTFCDYLGCSVQF